MPTAEAKPPKQMGAILLERGLVTSAQIEQALAEQKKAGHRKLLGETIVELGFCTEDDVTEVLAEANGMPYAKVTPDLVDTRVVPLLPRDFIEKHCVLPMFKVDNMLTVAVSEPSNLFLIEEIGQVAGCPVQTVATTARDIKSCFPTVLPDDKVFVIEDILEGASDAGLGDEAEASFDISELEEGLEGSPVVKLVNYIIFTAVREGASDIHIEPDENQLRIRLRLDGRLVERLRPPTNMAAPLASRIKIMASLDISERRLPQDGAIHVKMDGRPIDLRVSTLPNPFGEKVVMRIIDNSNVLVSLEHLGFDEQTIQTFRHEIRQPHGLLLVTGPTGSGKSTTLYSALSELSSPEINICTVEDPIEFNLVDINQFQVNDRIGFTFPTALRSLLRQDPDVIMVGEIRDADTARIAIQSALTGHMVFSTLHTNDSAGAITRLYNLGVEQYLISASLSAVLGQRLVRKLCPHCSETIAPPSNLVTVAERLGQKVDQVFTGAGCGKCRRTGFLGRVGIFEMLVPDDALRDAITSGANLEQLRRLAVDAGMKTLLADGFEKIRQGMTTIEEVLRVTAA